MNSRVDWNNTLPCHTFEPSVKGLSFKSLPVMVSGYDTDKGSFIFEQVLRDVWEISASNSIQWRLGFI